jgi:hypothetical protein
MDFNYAFQGGTQFLPSTEDPNFPAENLRNPIRSKVWRSDGIDPAGEWVTVDLATSEDINSVVVVWDSNEGIKLTNSAVVKIQASSTNFWASPPVDVTLTIDQVSLIASHYFTTAQTYRYWRVLVIDPTNDIGYIEIPKVIICNATELVQPPEVGFGFKIEDTTRISNTAFLNHYADVYPNRKSLSLNWSVMLYSDWETLAQIFERKGTAGVFAVVIDPDEVLFDKDRFFLYCRFASSLDTTQHVRDLFDQKIELVEVF